MPSNADSVPCASGALSTVSFSGGREILGRGALQIIIRSTSFKDT